MGTGEAVSEPQKLTKAEAECRMRDIFCAELLPPEARRILRDAALQAFQLDGLMRRVVIDEACDKVWARWPELFRDQRKSL